MRRHSAMWSEKLQIVSVLVGANLKLSNLFDRLLPASVQKDGNREFRTIVAPLALSPNSKIYDLGGGSQPSVSREDKDRLSLTVVGLDVSREELDGAPIGAYDQKIVADLCTYVGEEDADFVICQATLEHVPDVTGAVRAISSTLRPGGAALIFAPCRNALFARLNLLLPQRVKEKILFTLIPEKATGHEGFPAFYDNCTPRQIEQLARKYGLLVESRSLFWKSSYFKVFFPAYLTWRVYQAFMYIFLRENATETFIYILRKPRK